ncbi:MAG: 30S ribosomal protein S8e [archaeon]
MVLDQQKSVRKETGARYKSQHRKKKEGLGRSPTLTKIDAKSAKRAIRTRGGSNKLRVLRTNIVNLYDPKAKKFMKAIASIVVENVANRHYVRRNIITKGTVITTDKGNAKVTSRPGQDGVINATLV